jgi:HD-GYP domain-containing protein (c-di-GMP phosphodiesterase class II)
MSLLSAKPHPPASPEDFYQTAQQEVARLVAAVSSGKPCELGALQRVVADLIASLTREDALVVLALKEGETHLDLPRHLVNVAILAIKIGQGIGYGEEDLRRLALAACLHDVGMTSIPRRILEKPGVLAPEELAFIRQHPEQGFRMLQALGPEFEWVAIVALHEQEREDGSGYPQGLKGDQIHEYAKVVGLADVYESLTHARSFRSKRAAYDAPEIARQSARIFPDRLLQAMVRNLSTPPATTSPPPQATSAKPTQEGQPAAAAAAAASAAAGTLPMALYRAARQEVAPIVAALSSGKPCELGPLQAAVGGLLESLARGDELLALALEGSETLLDLPRHLVNVAILAIKIGQGIGYGEEELWRLALAACLHDVGMTSIPRRILEKSGALTPEELALIRQHPEQGFRMLKALGPEFEWVAIVARHEHERQDGSGYPQGLKGDQIHEYAKIVGVADAYEALTHARPYQKIRVPLDAVKEIVTTNRHMFPTRILKGLIQGLSTFPVGSLVRLNSKEIVRVVATNPAFPMRPVVEIIAGPSGERLASPRRVDLAQNSLVYITDSATHDVVDHSGQQPNESS